MEIVSIEKKTFEMMLASFNALSEKVASGAKATAGGWKGGSRARRSAGS